MEDREMTVFISWSQSMSHRIAEVLKSELDVLFNEQIDFWVSSEDIPAGNIAVNSIISALQRSSMAIVCLDSSNYKKPWIYYETGVVFGRNYSPEDDEVSVVFPIIFDNLKIPDFDSTPLQNMQLQLFKKESMKEAVLCINDMYCKKTGKHALSKKTLRQFFDQIWPALNDKISLIIKQGDNATDMKLTASNVTERLMKYQFPEPTYGDVIRYASGFETQDFYRFLLENVVSRLYIFGRKNRKLSEPFFDESYARLIQKNVDLKILFLDPNSEYAQRDSAQDISDFRFRLITSIRDFKKRYEKLNLDISEHCRLYSKQRESEIIIADDIVLYKDLSFSPDGKPAHFTNQSFFISSINSQLGTEYYKIFNSTWDGSREKKITSVFINSLDQPPETKVV